MVDASTIAALATPAGEGGIGIIRISGPQALAVAGSIFRTKRGTPPSQLPSHSVTLGGVYHPRNGILLDEGLLLVMRAPRSYTGEDTAEIQVHGGRGVTAVVLEAALLAGAQPATPGEFTRRAFLNGRIDLCQAEAVADLIAAEAEGARAAALAQLRGGLSMRIGALRTDLLHLVAETESALDFDESEGQAGGGGALDQRIGALLDGLAETRERSREGELYRDGVWVVIAGRPNVGKSSLMNLLLGQNRAIVTPHPGTTRDVVEGALLLDGIPLRLMDCAGIREAVCEIEQEGVRRSRELLAAAPVVILVVDRSAGITPADLEIAAVAVDRRLVIALNKADLPEAISLAAAAKLFPGAAVLELSSLTGAGLEPLKKELHAMAAGGVTMTGSPPWGLNIRQRHVLQRSFDLLQQARAALAAGIPLDTVASDLRRALETLGEITGETATEEILDAIFSRFCLGK